ncbi:hypothetical protein W97_09084 [Coniosporium apollinis CBS 100218]|uniref:RING-type domain-containing protein n=1 Tax=Coniosporium apollinis (strain CBS 100218) TaxID=1168221 RepID=R7Z7B5_CONA1|nr:uncharacterized protein W97_09084 [Coniosporium apollinis CBS 100218]EON69821.1 hypothetical protein W97_09084 [Coniosporium apollinis CBS 100218]
MPFDASHPAVQTACGHVFGKVCMISWLQTRSSKSGGVKRGNSCSMCRHVLFSTTEDGKIITEADGLPTEPQPQSSEPMMTPPSPRSWQMRISASTQPPPGSSGTGTSETPILTSRSFSPPSATSRSTRAWCCVVLRGARRAQYPDAEFLGTR